MSQLAPNPPASSCPGARYDTYAEAKSAGCGPYYEGETESSTHEPLADSGVVR